MPHSPDSPPAIPGLMVQAYSRVLAVAISLIVQVHTLLHAHGEGRMSAGRAAAACKVLQQHDRTEQG